LKLDPLFAGCLPSKPLALIGARQMVCMCNGTAAQKTTPCRRVCCARAHETEPSKYDPVVLLARNPIRCTRASPSGYQALRGQNMVACPAQACPVLNQGYQGVWGSIRNQDQGWGYQGSLISGSQAPLGTQGTSRISGISGIRIRDGGIRFSLISLIQHRACPLCLGRPHVEHSLGGMPFDCAAHHVGLADYHG
jgi:hypothetical protein